MSNRLEQIQTLLEVNKDNNPLLDFILDNITTDQTEFQRLTSWLLEKQKTCEAEVQEIGLKETYGDWIIDPDSGNISHQSGGFFKIIGVDVKTSIRESGKGWKQPMVDQGTESSIAGMLKQKQGDTYKYLIEAKFEPGNYGKVVISPTLQVTYSNLNQAHKGKKPLFAEFFDESNPHVEILYNQWQPEDGGRFFLKRVKYMIVELPGDLSLEISDNFMWVSVSSLKRALYLDSLVNPHVRSLLAVI